MLEFQGRRARKFKAIVIFDCLDEVLERNWINRWLRVHSFRPEFITILNDISRFSGKVLFAPSWLAHGRSRFPGSEAFDDDFAALASILQRRQDTFDYEQQSWATPSMVDDIVR